MGEASDESRRKVTVKEFLEREGQKSEGLLGYIAEERRGGAVIYSPIKPESEKGWKRRKNKCDKYMILFINWTIK